MKRMKYIVGLAIFVPICLYGSLAKDFDVSIDLIKKMQDKDKAWVVSEGVKLPRDDKSKLDDLLEAVNGLDPSIVLNNAQIQKDFDKAIKSVRGKVEGSSKSIRGWWSELDQKQRLQELSNGIEYIAAQLTVQEQRVAKKIVNRSKGGAAPEESSALIERSSTLIPNFAKRLQGIQTRIQEKLAV